MPEEGIDFGQFVEQGGCLVGRAPARGIRLDDAELEEKVTALPGKHSQLARQLMFLKSVLAVDPAGLPRKTRNEILFALLYAVADADLIPDFMAEIGYSDDAAITELVLLRHADFFERYCTAHEIEWGELKP